MTSKQEFILECAKALVQGCLSGAGGYVNNTFENLDIALIFNKAELMAEEAEKRNIL